MYIRIVTFELDGIDELQYLDVAAAIAPAFAALPGLRSKTWLADPASNTYGGVYVFESAEDADASRETDLWHQLGTNPNFANLQVREFGVIEELAAVTGGQ
jgi:hypothetical protein